MNQTYSITLRLACEYLRVSYDRSGRERSQDEQHDDNVSAVELLGMQLVNGYRESGSASASRYAQKEREEFDRLLADLESGRFPGQVLVLWEISRGSRKVGDWVRMCDACEKHGISIYVTTHGREYHPGNGRDRRSLLEDAVDAEYESSKVSMRATRASTASAKAGAPHGRVPYGYIRRYDERTRRLVGQDPCPEKAPIIQELFELLKKGHAFRAISRRFAEKGYLNLKGVPFHPSHLRVLALNPAYAGIRTHRASKDNPQRRNATITSGKNTTATWPALVSFEDFMTVQRILQNPKRVTTRPGGAKHFLSMIARCDVCGNVLAVTFRRPEKYPDGEYQCHQGGHVRCDKKQFDEIGETAILGYLARDDVYADMTAGQEQASTELAEVRDELAAYVKDLEDLRVKVATRTLSQDTLATAEPIMTAQIKELQQRESALATPSALRGLIDPGPDVADRWADIPMTARRAIARILLVPEHLGEMRLEPRPRTHSRRVRQPVTERVIWIRHDRPQITDPPALAS